MPRWRTSQPLVVPLFVLDTDHVSLFQRAHPVVRKHILALPFGSVVTTIVTVEEQLRGRMKAVRRASDGPSLIAAYDRMQATLELFRNLPFLGLTPPGHERFTHLQQQRIRIGTYDLRIAAIVLSYDGVLVTRNARDFSQVPGLEFEDWSVG